MEGQTKKYKEYTFWYSYITARLDNISFYRINLINYIYFLFISIIAKSIVKSKSLLRQIILRFFLVSFE